MGIHGTEEGQEGLLDEYLWFLRQIIYHILGVCYARYAAKYAKFITHACFPQRFITELHLVNHKKETVQSINFTSVNFEASLGKVYKMLKEILEGMMLNRSLLLLYPCNLQWVWALVMSSPRLRLEGKDLGVFEKFFRISMVILTRYWFVCSERATGGLNSKNLNFPF